jgi:hypothetical protein
MSKRIVCTICGTTVLSFAEPDDVDPDRLFELLEGELAKHRDVLDAEAAAQAAARGVGDAAPSSEAETWSRTLHLFDVVDEDDEAADLEVELENPELFYYGDMAGWW